MIAICIAMVRADERLANLGVVYMEGDILARRYDSILSGFLNIGVKYHQESQSKKFHYQSNSFSK